MEPLNDDSLTEETALWRAEEYLASIGAYPDSYDGRGIVICGGGERYFTNAWISISLLRHVGCRLPIQLWYLGPEELDAYMEELVAPLGVECVDARAVREHYPARILNGWEVKPFAVLHCPFREVMLLDADNFVAKDPEYLFDSLEYREFGALFWPDLGRLSHDRAAWRLFGVPFVDEPEVESGQLVVDKSRCWRALCLTKHYNDYSDFYYQYVHGDKETYHFAFHKVSQPYAMTPYAVRLEGGTMFQHDFEGEIIFQHRNQEKWLIHGENVSVPGFRLEAECRQFLDHLRDVWDGRIGVSRDESLAQAVLNPIGGTAPRRLILRNGQSPGDIVMLTAAVRDLHRTYPGAFSTDVRTSCAEIWENNPYITSISEDDDDVEVIDCEYPLIHRSNDAPYHFIHGFIDHLNERLGLAVRPTAFRGDIYISDLEKSWYSQVEEVFGQPIPFWIVVAGGKTDYTTKWWAQERYQRVVDHFAGRILFVQVGENGHTHPALRGVLDLRGKTTLRQLIRLVYHAHGVLCPVTLMMHLAAAVECPPGRMRNRPCVVVAGGREPPHWEAYPHHQFLHRAGALQCCDNGGCWKSRVVPLGDGDEKDAPENCCVDVVGSLPRCMDLITPEDVIRAIEVYFAGGAIDYLTPDEVRSIVEPHLEEAS